MRWLGLVLYLAPAIALAAPDGKAIFLHGNSNGALPCAACHGANAQGNTAIGAPRLAGLPAAATETYLALFADRQGGSATMQLIAQALSPAETQAVAAYLAKLPISNSPAGPTNPSASGR
jgi:cytochrome c553